MKETWLLPDRLSWMVTVAKPSHERAAAIARAAPGTRDAPFAFQTLTMTYFLFLLVLDCALTWDNLNQCGNVASRCGQATHV